MQTKTIVFLTFFFLGIFSCKQFDQFDIESSPEINNSLDRSKDSKIVTDKATSVLNYIKSKGYNNDQIKDIGNYYSVDGDMLYPKNSDVGNVDGTQTNLLEEQAYRTQYNLIYNGIKQEKIRVKIDLTRIKAYEGVVISAMERWNKNYGRSNIYFVETVSGNSFDVLVTSGFVNPNTYAEGYLPKNGNPGELLYINVANFKKLTFLKQVAVLVHEFGHIIGFEHTDNVKAKVRTPIPEVGGLDAKSIMNSKIAATNITNLSENDIKALHILYPRIPYRLSITRSGRVTWVGPEHWIVGYDIWYKVTNGGTNGTVLYEKSQRLNLPIREAYFDAYIPNCECYGPSTLQFKVRTIYRDGGVSGFAAAQAVLL